MFTTTLRIQFEFWISVVHFIAHKIHKSCFSPMFIAEILKIEIYSYVRSIHVLFDCKRFFSTFTMVYYTCYIVYITIKVSFKLL